MGRPWGGGMAPGDFEKATHTLSYFIHFHRCCCFHSLMFHVYFQRQVRPLPLRLPRSSTLRTESPLSASLAPTCTATIVTAETFGCAVVASWWPAAPSA